MLASSASAMAFDWNGYISINPNPDMKVESLSGFSSFIINYDKNEVSVDTSVGMPYLTNTDTNVITYANSVQLWDMALQYMDQYAVQAVFPTLTEYGQYTLTLPAGLMKAASDGDTNPEMIFNYKVVDPNAPLDLPPLELISVDPAAGTALEAPGTLEGRVYTIDTNLNKEIAYIESSWYDVTDPDAPVFIATATNQHVDENGLIPDTPLEVSKVSVGGEKMYIGHSYEMRVKCYNEYTFNKKLVGELTINYTGACEEYIYSDIKIISVSPNPEEYYIEEPSQAKFSLMFSGPVTIDETLSGIPVDIFTKSSYESITSNEDKTEYTFVIPESVLKEIVVVNCFVVARDAEGRTVLPSAELKNYENGSDDEAGIMLSYTSAVSYKELTVTPESGTYSELKRFRVSCAINGSECEIGQSWQAFPYIVKGRNVVYQFNLENDIETDPDADYFDPYYYIDLVLPEAITESGNYALIIPAATFSVVHNGYDQYNSKSTVISYIVKGNEEDKVVYDLESTITPAPDSDVESISYFKVSFNESVGLDKYDAYLLDEQGNQIAKADIAYDEDYLNSQDFHITFSPAITEDGVYTLYIPQGTWYNEAYFMEGRGHSNPEIRANYSIKAVGVDTIAADRLSGDVYDITGKLVVRNASALQIDNLDKGIYIINGKKVVVK